MIIIQLDVVFVIVYLANACRDPLIGLEQTNATAFKYEASLVKNGKYLKKIVSKVFRLTLLFLLQTTRIHFDLQRLLFTRGEKFLFG